MTIIEAILDRQLFRPFLGKDLKSWRNWFAALGCVYGLPVPRFRHDVIRQCTGRDPLLMPKDGFSSTLFLTGRRSGKSRMSAVVGTYEAVLAGHEKKLAPGEKGVVIVVAPTRIQGRIVKGYLRGIFESSPMLNDQVAAEQTEGFDLKSGVRLEIMAGHFRSVRGFTLLAAIVDEVAFFGFDDESKVKSDTELIRAIRPGLATVGGKLICISSPYAKRGFCYSTVQKNFGNNDGRTLVWRGPSRVMNPTLKQSVIDDAMAEDPEAARSEYLGEFRDDISAFVSREVVESLVVRGRSELLPRESNAHRAFCDLSGGRVDDAALAIGHFEHGKVVIDYLGRWRSPFNPYQVIRQMADELRRFGITRVEGDKYGAEFVTRAFQSERIQYRNADKSRSELYIELLPRLNGHAIELIDNELLVNQLSLLERRTRVGGRDIVDHPPNGHDDLANVIAGVSFMFARQKYLGGLGAVKRRMQDDSFVPTDFHATQETDAILHSGELREISMEGLTHVD